MDLLEDFLAFEYCCSDVPKCENCGSEMVEDGEGWVCLRCEEER